MPDQHASPAQSLIGIWWDDGHEFVALAHGPNENSSGKVLIDSNLNHADEWLHVAGQFGRSASSEYFQIPRGRVLFNNLRQESVILHGTATKLARLNVIAKRFQLQNWTCRIDDHYQVGVDADRLFDELE
ncbi:MAG: hypothetical protein R3C18_07160 [Planctomycetaceae bacterium]